MRPWTPRPLAPLPPSRQPTWYTVMLSKRSRQPGRLSSNAAVMAAAPPPRMTSFSRRRPSGTLGGIHSRPATGREAFQSSTPASRRKS